MYSILLAVVELVLVARNITDFKASMIVPGSH